MASKTEIANIALSKLGQPRVSNVETTDTKPARIMNLLYDSKRDAIMQSYPWKFALKRTTLSPDGIAPSWGWDHSYTVPSDFLAVYRIRYNPEYEREGDKILTDEGTALYLQYISKVTTVGSYPPNFVEALASKLAMEAAEELTQSNTKKADATTMYRIAIDEAMRVDILDDPIEDLEDDAWVQARL